MKSFCGGWPTHPALLCRIFLLAMLGGCGVANERPSDVPSAFKANQTATLKQNDDFGALVVVRWPAVVDSAAAPVLEQNWVSVNQRLFTLPVIYRDVDEHGSQTMPIKTTYYVAEFYRSLSKRIPAKQIILQPQVVSLNSNGEIVLTPLQPLDVPATVTVDFVATPDIVLAGTNGTTAEHLMILTSIATAPKAAPITHGAIVATGVLDFPKRVLPSEATAYDGLHPLFLEWAGAKIPVDDSMPRSSSPPARMGEVLDFPFVSYDLTVPRIKAEAAQSFHIDEGYPTIGVLDSLANTVVDALDVIDRHEVQSAALAQFAAYYDLPLSERLTSGAVLEPTDNQKVDGLIQVANAEADFLSADDQAFVESVLNGEFGKSYRIQRVAEYEHRQDFWKQEMIASFGVFGAGMASLGTTGAVFSPTVMQQGLTIVGQNEQQHEDMKRAFFEHFGATMGEQRTYTIQFTNDRKTVVAKSYPELRETIRTQYKSYFGT